ncbi:peptidase family M28 [Coccidioides immitis RS]|uniref:Peptide hydrolase n=3 Tax=Coccidioides immitis TaxID=5501 RepID=A0A0D8JW79_COCIM|nr:peptidase family M28 [Coccidioides immitis RS]KJF61572.1 peptidase family M28 [Coccidioides immitis RS]KMU79620.1 hypothetical protein CISG_02038 [Coccidioides immitis RMSCC 3703]KMU91492.1 hypothetical protein CIHG_09244 [Coccidioides immitis H538.4]TPX19820.1 hypothetical protein DIZ76_017612 [Coccidioides immitis]
MRRSTDPRNLLVRRGPLLVDGESAISELDPGFFPTGDAPKMSSTTRRRFNLIAFTPGPVTVISSLVYLALLIPLLLVHTIVPSAPKSNPKGVDLSEAWNDLQHLTSGFHPYNSHRNDEIHQWLLQRIGHILDASRKAHEDDAMGSVAPDVFVFDDQQSNLTFSGGGVGNKPITGVYFEGKNIIVYIRGLEDDKENWWDSAAGKPKGKGGVLVNAHYDSVSTGFGATDDGVGVVSVLQLIKFFTSPGNLPRKGLVLLLNNGEEDYLNGARAYSQHPLSKYTHTFLNLEGAGAGGRAALFRTTDTEVTRFYKSSPHPFGSVLAADGFKMGLIRSETDYAVFKGVLGLRGLDVAFIEPRARYHTDQDDVRHTSIDSVWHMLSAAIATTKGLVSYTGSEFDGRAPGKGMVNSGVGTHGVWFDLFGSSFAVFRLHTLFAISVTLLVVCPIVLFVIGIILSKMDKMYLFSIHETIPETKEKVSVRGLRGLFRYPIILVVSSGILIGLSYLLAKVNPFIIHSSSYAVWSMMLSSWIFMTWFLSCIADFFRPSALHRAYTFTWQLLVMWVLLVIGTVYVNQHDIAAGYFIVFYFAGTFLATLISYLELFALPNKTQYAREQSQYPSGLGSNRSSRILSPSADELPTGGDNHGEIYDGEEEPTESSSLLGRQRRTTFANYTRTGRDLASSESGTYEDHSETGVFGEEQKWSASLPTWTWVLQFLFLGPVVIMFIGQLGLFLTSAMNQVGADGVGLLVVYIAIAVFSVLLLIPLSPFIHRFTYHVPTFLLLVFIATLIYNLAAFPFSAENRLKIFFVQELNLDTGRNQVSLTGVDPYVQDIIRAIPSASKENISCDSELDSGRRKCSWPGLAPEVVQDEPTDKWLSFNISKPSSQETKDTTVLHSRLHVSGKNTRACRLNFDRPIRDYSLPGSALDDRMPHTLPQGISEIRLWSRTWENVWTVDVQWDAEDVDELHGRVVCLWSDANQLGSIPALDELRLFAPPWVAISKLKDGLVEVSRGF